MSRSPAGRRRATMAAALAALAAAGGCGIVRPSTELHVTSLTDEPVTLTGRFRTRFYAHDPEGGTSFILSDLTPSEILSGRFTEGQVIHVRLLWIPKPGSTPMDRTATNASVRHIIFADGQVGVYGGAGFFLPRGRLGAETVGLRVREASLRLLESTDGFVDLLTPAELAGTLTASHDRNQTRRLYFHVSQHVTNRLGRSRFVRREEAPTAPAARSAAPSVLPRLQAALIRSRCR